MKQQTEQRKPGNVEEVNQFLGSLPSHRGVVPLVHCGEPSCTTLLSVHKYKATIITKKGDSFERRICKRCTSERLARGETVL